jgi:hypothetical protein
MPNTWFTGAGPPAATLGEDDDLYLDIDLGRIFRKTASTWQNVGLLRAGALGRGPGWLSGMGTPSASFGDEGDIFLDVSSGRAYKKVEGSWLFLIDLKGPAGPAPCASYQSDGTVLVPPNVETELGRITGLPTGTYAITAKASFVYVSAGSNISTVVRCELHGSVRWGAPPRIDEARVTLMAPTQFEVAGRLVQTPALDNTAVVLVGRKRLEPESVLRFFCQRTIAGTGTDRLSVPYVRMTAIEVSPL